MDLSAGDTQAAFASLSSSQAIGKNINTAVKYINRKTRCKYV